MISDYFVSLFISFGLLVSPATHMPIEQGEPQVLYAKPPLSYTKMVSKVPESIYIKQAPVSPTQPFKKEKGSMIPPIPTTYYDIIAQYDWNADNMFKIAKCESSLRPHVINSTSVEYSVGLFQVNTFVHKQYTIDELKDPVINIKSAYEIYKREGYYAWKRCSMKFGFI